MTKTILSLSAGVLFTTGVLFMPALVSCGKTGAKGKTQPPTPTDTTKFNPGVAANGCRMIGITDSMPGSAVAESFNFYYDSSGWEDSMRAISYQGPVLETFKRNGEALVMLTTGASFNLVDSITLNGYGLMTRDAHSVGSTGVNTYIYSGTSVQQSNYQGPSSDLVTAYYWNSGDMTSWNAVLYGGSADVVKFGYDTVASSAGDYWHLANMISYPAPWIMTAHRVISVTSANQTFNYVYAEDAAGKITSMTVTLGGVFQTKYAYTYDCH